MDIIGKITVDLGETSGTSQRGNAWKKREYVLETQETYPKKVHFDFFGDRADTFRPQIGEVGTLTFDIESREYNGRWYTSIRGLAWRPMEAQTPGAAAPQAYPGAPAPQAPVYPQAPAGYPQYGAQAPGAVPPPPAAPAQEPTDDLPF